MTFIQLSNGHTIPQMGVGTWTLKDEVASENVKLALRAGFRHIDTAQAYDNEAAVGQGITESGTPREEIFLTTKVSTINMRKEAYDIRQSIVDSMEKLQTSYLDLLLIHWPVKDCVPKTWRVMEELVQEGKIRSLGVSNFNRHHLEDLLSYAQIKPVINQIEVHPLFSNTENITFNQSLGIQVQAWGPFGQGDIDVIGHPTIQELAQRYDKTPSQIVLRWIIQRGLITIPRAKPNHFAENLAIESFELDEQDMALLMTLNQDLRSNVLNNPENFPW